MSNPTSCLVDSTGNVYVGQKLNIFMISYPSLTTAANVIGSTVGNVDGSGTAAKFQSINGMCWGTAAKTTIFLTDTVNSVVRQVTSAATTSFKASGITFPWGIIADSTYANLYVTNYNTAFINVIYKVVISSISVSQVAGTSSASGYVDSTLASSIFNFPYGMAVDSSGNIVIADSSNAAIRQMTSTNVYTLAGTGVSGSTDGSASSTKFTNPSGIVYIGSGIFLVIDKGYVRKLTSGKPLLLHI